MNETDGVKKCSANCYLCCKWCLYIIVGKIIVLYDWCKWTILNLMQMSKRIINLKSLAGNGR